MSLVKSKQRVADHGEVFTPAWMVEAMLDLVKDETERIDSRFLEPACGSGNFIRQILRRKLAAVELKYGQSDFERRHYALLGLMCIYGIELLADNIAECRANVLEIFAEYLQLDGADDLYRAAAYVLSQNLVHGDALTVRAQDQSPISFAERAWMQPASLAPWGGRGHRPQPHRPGKTGQQAPHRRRCARHPAGTDSDGSQQTRQHGLRGHTASHRASSADATCAAKAYKRALRAGASKAKLGDPS